MQWNSTAIDRFWQKISQDGDCWRWTGAHSRSYGTMGLKPYHRIVYAHRFAYEYFIGPIPDGMEIDHVAERGCRFRDCVNPDHLEAVTRRINILRSSNFAAEQARRTHCPQGHPYDDANTRTREGHRECRACYRNRHPVGLKLDAFKAAEIRRRHMLGESASALAKEFNVGYQAARRVITGTTWRQSQGGPGDQP